MASGGGEPDRGFRIEKEAGAREGDAIGDAGAGLMQAGGPLACQENCRRPYSKHAIGMNRTASAIETRFEIVSVKRSEMAAKTIRAGEKRAAASSMIFQSPFQCLADISSRRQREIAG